jgi:phosphoribosylanthranilate isomerase
MRDADNIRELAQLPIDYMGFIFYPKSARYVERRPDVKLPQAIKKVGVFVNETAEVIRQKAAEHQLNAVQLHGNEPVKSCVELQETGLEVFKVFGIDETFDWTTVEPYLSSVDYFLFDTKSPQHGGTGQTFNWNKLHEYPFEKPYFLSGGLSLENIAEAIAFEDSRLIGLDLNSKFEIAPGQKDISTLKQALKIIENE